MISVISVLGQFADAALKPHNRMRRHTHALDLLRLICNICNDGDRALDRVDILERTLAEHHVMYDQLYAHLSKPKLHFGRHIPQSMRRHGSNMNCFPTERRHKQSIRSAKFIFNNMCRSLLAADMHSFFSSLNDEDAFSELKLNPPVLDARGMVATLVNKNRWSVFCSSPIATRIQCKRYFWSW